MMGFCTPEQVEKFLDGAPVMEKAMVDAGIILLKYWLEVTPKEQERRLRDRINDGRKIWKLSPMDIKSFNLWDEYTVARDAMFASTDTARHRGLWRARKIKRVRLNIISHLLSQIRIKNFTLKKWICRSEKLAKSNRQNILSDILRRNSDKLEYGSHNEDYRKRYCFVGCG